MASFFAFTSEEVALLHRGGLERVKDYPSAIQECLEQLKEAGAIEEESELSAIGFKTVLAQSVTGCVALSEEVLKDMEAGNQIAPAHNPPYLTGFGFSPSACRTRLWWGCSRPPSTNGFLKLPNAMECLKVGLRRGGAAGGFTGPVTNS